MAVSYVKFLKHAVKVAKTAGGSRPILQGVCHYTDGSLAVTDSHRLYFAKNAHETTEQIVRHPTTGEKIEGNYPEIKRILPGDGEQFQVVLNVLETWTALKMMLLIEKKSVQVRFVAESHDLMMKVKTYSTEVSFNAGGLNVNDKAGESDAVNALVNSKFLLEAFDFFKDLDLQYVTMKFYGNNRPMTFGTDDLTALVLPIREKAVVK